MYKHLPPLKALTFFESTARHLSFSKAADELYVTQSAVSYQIRKIEQFYEKQLFIRQGKRLSLTHEGQQLLYVIQRAFNSINGVSAKLKGQLIGVTRFLVYSSFAIKWLVPRISEFRKIHPEIDLRLEMNTELDANLEAKQADCGITIDKNNDLYHYIHLIGEEKVIVCGNQILKQIDKRSPEHFLRTLPLLVSDDLEEWKLIFKRLNIPLPQKKYHFSHAILLQQAAIEGQGLALCAESIVKNDIRAGLLHKIEISIKEKITTDFYFSVLKERLNEPPIQALIRWLKSCL